jgi:hypothetical protein
VPRAPYKLTALIATHTGATLTSAALAAKPDGWFQYGFVQRPDGYRSMMLSHVGDTVTLVDALKNNVRVQRAIANQIARGYPAWLELNSAVGGMLARSKDFPVDLKDQKVEGTLRVQPTREELSYPVNEQYIVELYSK